MSFPAYMNDTLFKCYIADHLIPVLGGWHTPFTLYLMGSYKIPTIFNIHRQNSIPSLTSGRCISIVQPLATSVNNLFEELLGDPSDQRIFELESSEVFEKQTIGGPNVMTAECIGNAFNQFYTQKEDSICGFFMVLVYRFLQMVVQITS